MQLPTLRGVTGAGHGPAGGVPAAAATLNCTGKTSPEVSPRASAGLQASVENDLLQRSFLQNAVFPSQNTELM